MAIMSSSLPIVAMKRYRLLQHSLLRHHQRVWMSSSPVSPYKTLQISPSATVDQIKAAFRKLAKMYHPDVNRSTTSRGAERNAEKMSEIVDAYESLLADDFRGRDSRVALACEMFTLEELRLNRRFIVRTLQINFFDDQELAVNVSRDDSEVENVEQALSKEAIYQITVHPDDSVADLKHSVQEKFAHAWGLHGRRLDRYGLALGWELIVVGNTREIMSDHFFLEKYNIRGGDMAHAVLQNDLNYNN